ncbi:lysophospholipid acyltransferase 1 isoform X1 [Leptopilina heterotoma]|uniref:lysophospholipid acyltransferase 1 isoform X1 n=2 Tax=Leptopilina heterotoma TaxID=63436 RepID=UPI001CA925B0|nr:lysophospholipid acyltransferase 1 isoform X1 [Leptopilina heterotoma]
MKGKYFVCQLSVESARSWMVVIMTAIQDETYFGFQTFAWLADYVNLPIDQVNFLITQFTALGLAGILRSSLNPNVTSPATRHAFVLIFGLALGYFNFGKHAIHLAGLPTICYIVMRTQDPKVMQRFVLVIALSYLSCIHLHRQFYNGGSYTLDITGPLMVITQKVTSLAYSIHDGLCQMDEDLTPSQRHQAVRKMPTMLEYFSYIFHFQSIMAGPIILYHDYIDFIHGQRILEVKSLNGYSEKTSNEIVLEPSPATIVVKKVLTSLFFALVFVTFIPSYSIVKVKDDEFLEKTSIIYKFWYLTIATMLVRFKYYHAWIMADAICNNSGLGFNGFDENQQSRWDKVSNVDAFKFETALSLRDSIEAWNKGTNRWLRSLVYERMLRNKTAYTYALSALWHGFHPGYYLTFANGAFFTYASRIVRRHVRPHFLISKKTKLFYDIITFLTTKVILTYTTFTFVLLELKPSITMYLHLYLFPNILGLTGILFLPVILPLTKQKSQTSKTELSNGHVTTNGHAHKIE